MSIKSLWLKWTQPHPSLTSNADRVRSQALASILLVLFIIGILFEVCAIILNATTAEFLMTEIPIIMLIGLMIIPSRRRYYRVVALSLSFVITIGCFALTIFSAYQPTLVYMALGYLLVATALPTAWSLVVGVLNVLLTLSAPLFVDAWTSLADITIELSFIIVATVAVYALTSIQRYYMTVNEEKSRELKSTNALLQEKIKHLEETQAQQEQTHRNFQKVFYSSPDPIVVNRFHDGKYIAHNQSFLNTTGYTEDDLRDMDGRDLFANQETADRYLRQLLREKHIFSTEYDVTTKSGQVRTYLLSSEFIDWEEERCVLCMARDITVHKQAQQQQLDMMKEQERSALLQQFISNASHDFRTPLATIGTSVHLIRKLDDETRRARHLTTIERQVQRINTLVDSLTMMYMLDSHDIALHFYPVDINELLTDIINRHPNPAQISIKQNLTPDLPKIPVDDYYLKVAIKHLLENALRFTPDNGQVTISTGHYEAINRLCICIKDTGVGMDADTLKNIFNRLYRGDTSRNQDTGGAGLGLSITQKIIEEHHGTITVESELNEGTQFKILLPLKQPSTLAMSAD